MTNERVAQVRDALRAGLGRRDFLRATAAASAVGVAVTAAGATGANAVPQRPTAVPGEVLQPGRGPIHGQHYLKSTPDQVRWGYVPSLGSKPVLQVGSGETVTVDTVSHEGILEDQGRDPAKYFAAHGVSRSNVLDDAVAIAKDYNRTARNFDVDGPHVVTGPIYVKGATPGDVLKVDMLSMLPRVPYGVVSSRHGKGALPQLAG
ncbi:MAG TPA: acetamidase/formamidase family protein, partial [Kribbella sp.]